WASGGASKPVCRCRWVATPFGAIWGVNSCQPPAKRSRPASSMGLTIARKRSPTPCNMPATSIRRWPIALSACMSISGRWITATMAARPSGCYFLLPHTAGCYTADDAIRTARLGREVGLSDWVKVEVIGDERTLYPDVQATIEATRVLAKEGFTVLPYTNDDVVAAKRLLDA